MWRGKIKNFQNFHKIYTKNDHVIPKREDFIVGIELGVTSLRVLLHILNIKFGFFWVILKGKLIKIDGKSAGFRQNLEKQ